MPNVTPEELREIIKEVLADGHSCRLTHEEVSSLRTVSAFVVRFRNALGNALMVLILVVLVMAVGGLLYLATAGHINLFRMFGVGA
jgi:hypothetical protein